MRKREPVQAPERRMNELAEAFPKLKEIYESRSRYYGDLEEFGLGRYARKDAPVFSLLAAAVCRDALFDVTGDPAAAGELFTGYSLMYGLGSSDVAVWDMWRTCKHVYRFEPDFGRMVAGQPLGDGVPCEVLDRMPYPLVYVECPMTLDEGEALGCWLYVDPAYFVGKRDGEPVIEKSLVCLKLASDMKTYPLVISLESETVEEAVEELVMFDVANDARRGVYADRDAARMRIMVEEALNLALYVCSEQADVEIGYVPKASLSNPKKRGRSSAASVHDVGYRIASALSKVHSKGGEASGGGWSVAPHVRRAHWHHYWTGPRDGERRCIVKWLPPIPVNVGEGDTALVVHEEKG